MNILKSAALAVIMGACSLNANAQNPYLPLWEFIPDSEPYVFEDPDKPGHYRVYIYGSHDSLRKAYCGLEQVTWSAPVDDLTNWRYDGIIFKSLYGADGRLLNPQGEGDVLYAPDIVERVEQDGSKTYYLYPNVQNGGRQGAIAKSNRPDGPFEICNWTPGKPNETYGILRFDPGVLIDDDGRVYGYWGFEGSYGAELDPNTMCTVKPGTEVVKDMIPSYKQDDTFRFFEASSIRKIEDKYVFIYSRFTRQGEFGLPMSNYTLAYAYSDNPLGPFTYGGTIIDGRGRDKDKDGNAIVTAHSGGNTHGSICQINGKWWVFYHRQTGLNEYTRQAMVAPIDVKVEKGRGGKVTISEAELTSEGFMTEGLDPLARTQAGIACYYVGPEKARNEYPNFYFAGPYTEPRYLDLESCDGPFNMKTPFMPIVNTVSGSVVGYKYFNFKAFGKNDKATLAMRIIPQGIDGTISVRLGSPEGTEIGTLRINKDMPQKETEIHAEVTRLADKKGKQPLFFVFSSPTPSKSICTIHDFVFH